MESNAWDRERGFYSWDEDNMGLERGQLSSCHVTQRRHFNSKAEGSRLEIKKSIRTLENRDVCSWMREGL